MVRMNKALLSLLALVIFTCGSHRNAYPDDKPHDDDIDQVLFIKSPDLNTFILHYLKLNIDSERGKRKSGEAFSFIFSGQFNDEERMVWRKGGRIGREPARSIWSLRSAGKGVFPDGERQTMNETVRKVLADGEQKMNPRILSTQGSGMIYVGEDNDFELVSMIGIYPLTKQELSSFQEDITYTPIESAYLQIDELFSKAAWTVPADTPIRLAMFLVDQIASIDRARNGQRVRIVPAIEISHQLRVRVNINVRGYLDKTQRLLLDKIATSFKASTEKHKWIKISFTGVGLVETKTKGPLSDFEMALIELLVAEIQSKQTVAEIKIDAKFNKGVGDAKSDNDDHDR